ncbi:MAG: DUF2993 domain-containing protein [Actinomycetota bacterium]|nr:DUF2993 domain-containing protein [Actinomycetota bacterium]
MRVLLGWGLTLLVVAAAAVAIDAWVTAEAEQRASARVSASLSAPTVVDLQGWPVGLRLLGGSVPRARITARGVPLAGTQARISRLTVTLTDLRVRWRELDPSAAALRARAAHGRFRADLDEQAVRRLLRLPRSLDLLGVELVEGAVRLEAAGLPVIDASVAVEGEALVMHPQSPPLDRIGLRVDLPALPGDARVQGVQVVPGRLRVFGSVQELQLAAAHISTVYPTRTVVSPADRLPISGLELGRAR